MAKKGKKPRRRKASYRKPKRKVDRKLQSSQSLNPTSRLSGGPGSAGPWPMNPYGASFGGMSMAGLREQESMRPKTENTAITQRQREVERIQNNHTINLNLLGGGGAGGAGDNVPLRPEWSGNTLVLKPGNGYDKIVIVSN